MSAVLSFVFLFLREQQGFRSGDTSDLGGLPVAESCSNIEEYLINKEHKRDFKSFWILS